MLWIRVLTSARSNGLLTKSLAPALQRAQLVSRLGGDHEHRKIAVRFDFLQAFHHLESIHAGHLQIEQDQVVVVIAMQRADCMRIHRRGDAAHSRHSRSMCSSKLHVGILIVHDQDTWH